MLASSTTDMFLWGGVVGLAMIATGVALIVLRRKLRPGEGNSQSEAPSAFTIEGLEAMRAAGGITDQEFRRLRRAALGLPEAGDSPAETVPDPEKPGPDAEKPHPPLSLPPQDDDG